MSFKAHIYDANPTNIDQYVSAFSRLVWKLYTVMVSFQINIWGVQHLAIVSFRFSEMPYLCRIALLEQESFSSVCFALGNRRVLTFQLHGVDKRFLLPRRRHAKGNFVEGKHLFGQIDGGDHLFQMFLGNIFEEFVNGCLGSNVELKDGTL